MNILESSNKGRPFDLKISLILLIAPILPILNLKFSIKANALNIPPGKYGRKIKTQRT